MMIQKRKKKLISSVLLYKTQSYLNITGFDQDAQISAFRNRDSDTINDILATSLAQDLETLGLNLI